MDKIILILLSKFDSELVDTLKAGLERTFCRKVKVRYKINNLSYAYDAARMQYVSPRLLSRLKRIKREPGDKILGVVDIDLYSPGYDFVYGEADIGAGVATLSSFRLISENETVRSDFDLIAVRLTREAYHEVGHLYGLGHCQNPKCFMRTCTCLEEVDEATNNLCPECQRGLEANLESPMLAVAGK